MPIRNHRNPVARAAILRKGGVHEKCRASKRQQQKRELEDAVSAYYLSVESSYEKSTDRGKPPEKHDKRNRRGSDPDLKKILTWNENTNKTKKATRNSGFFSFI